MSQFINKLCSQMDALSLKKFIAVKRKLKETFEGEIYHEAQI